MPVQSTEMSIPGKRASHLAMVRIGAQEHLLMRLTDCLNKRESAVPPDVALVRRTKRNIPEFRPLRSLLDAVGPSLLCATDLAYR